MCCCILHTSLYYDKHAVAYKSYWLFIIYNNIMNLKACERNSQSRPDDDDDDDDYYCAVN